MDLWLYVWHTDPVIVNIKAFFPSRFTHHLEWKQLGDTTISSSFFFFFWRRTLSTTKFGVDVLQLIHDGKSVPCAAGKLLWQ